MPTMSLDWSHTCICECWEMCVPVHFGAAVGGCVFVCVCVVGVGWDVGGGRGLMLDPLRLPTLRYVPVPG